MIYKVTSNEISSNPGTFYNPFVTGTGDIEIILETDINLTLTAPLIFFNAVSSVKINTNGFKCILNGFGIIFKDISLVEVSGITVNNFIGDGIQLNNVANFKVKHCTFTGHVSNKNEPKASDEAISSVKGSGSIYGEIAWCKFDSVFKGILCGTGDTGDDVLDVNQKLYIHHNYFKDFERRAPYCRYGKYSIYNNVFENWKYRDTQTFCIWAEDNATAFVLSNAFIQDKYSWFDGFPKRLFSWFTKRPWSMDQGTIARFGAVVNLANNYKNCDWIKLEGVSGTPTVAPNEYEFYTDTMIATVKAKAGSGIS